MSEVTLVSEIGYAAGFYDGEGSISTMNNDRNIFVSITQKDKDPLLKIQLRFGGHIYFYDGYWYLRFYGREMREFILTIFTLLSKRRKNQILVHKNHFNVPKVYACPNGHPYTESSFKWVYRDGGMYRSCKICRREKMVRRRLG